MRLVSRALLSLVIVVFAGCGDSSTDPPTPVQVNMQNSAFSPLTVTVQRGGSVRWTNLDNFAHNAVGTGFNTGNITLNQSATATFNLAGTFQYACSLHPGMNGTVIVTN